MSAFSACHNSKYSTKVWFNVNGGFLAPKTISDRKKDGNTSNPIGTPILFAEGD